MIDAEGTVDHAASGASAAPTMAAMVTDITAVVRLIDWAVKYR